MRSRESRWSSLLSCFRPRASPSRSAAPAPRPTPRPPAPRQQQEQQQSVMSVPPPASARALKRLPRVRVRVPTACCICLEDQEVTALRMPCGHRFHESCLLEWLRAHCTCPVCRFEIGTDSAAFERERHYRNRTNRRFVTISRRELDELPVKAVRDLLEAAGESERRAVERRDLIDIAVQSDHVDVVEDRLFATLSEIKLLSIGELMRKAKVAGVPTRGLVEKQDLVRALVDKGEIVLR